MVAMIGPINSDPVFGFALRIDKYDQLPGFPYMHAKPYYKSYLEQAGLNPRHREISYLIDLAKTDNAFLLSMKNIAELKIRPVTSRSYLQDHDIVIDIFNVSFVDKWYFSGYDHATSRKYWSEHKPFVDPDLFLIAEIENKPVGFLNAFPDLNPSIQALQSLLEGWWRRWVGSKWVTLWATIRT